ncbi:MAG: GNAT family N-acetyltransferase, partial [Acidobacteriota bacterium]|nr:GNAT family N-acetyltransferase [Acidobacteriota bacterium]
DHWSNFRQEFFRQHSLKQLHAQRPMPFKDPRRRALFDMLFESPELAPHVSMFSVNGQMLAAHFGLVWRGVLMFGASSFKLEEEQRSPAMILLSWIVQNASELNLRGLDLTIGRSEFKQRLGNRCVQLSMISLYRTAGAFRFSAARATALKSVKSVVGYLGGPSAWDQKVKPLFSEAQGGPISHSLKPALQNAVSTMYTKTTELTLAITPERLVDLQEVAIASRVQVRENSVDDLLSCTVSTADTAAQLSRCVRRLYARGRGQGRTLHTILVEGELAGWGLSDKATNEDISAVHGCSADAILLSGFFLIPAFRCPEHGEEFLREVIRQYFRRGVSCAYIMIDASSHMMQPIHSLGFKAVRKHRRTRVATREWSSFEDLL